MSIDPAEIARLQDAQRAFVRAAMSKMNVDATNLARRAGLSPSTLSRFLNNPHVEHLLSGKTLARITGVSGVPVPPDISSTIVPVQGGAGYPGGHGQGGGYRGAEPLLPAGEHRGWALTSDVDMATLQAQATGAGTLNDLPIYAAAQGGDGALLIDWEPIEWMRRPDPLARVKGGFGVYVVGESMVPAYEPGDRILCHPSRPAFRGDDVLIVKHAEPGLQEALVKRLERQDTETLVVRQWNPPHEFSIARAVIEHIYLIVGKFRRG